MCGRTSLSAAPEDLREIFGLEETPRLSPHYNVPPSQPLAVVRVQRAGAHRTMDLLRWGLVPFWAEDRQDRPSPGPRARRDGRLDPRVPRRHPPSPLPRRRRRLLRVEAARQEREPALLLPPDRRGPVRARGGLGSLGVEGRRGARVVRDPHPSRPDAGGRGPRPHARRARPQSLGPLAGSSPRRAGGSALAPRARRNRHLRQPLRQRSPPRRSRVLRAMGARAAAPLLTRGAGRAQTERNARDAKAARSRQGRQERMHGKKPLPSLLTSWRWWRPWRFSSTPSAAGYGAWSTSSVDRRSPAASRRSAASIPARSSSVA